MSTTTEDLRDLAMENQRLVNENKILREANEILISRLQEINEVARATIDDGK